MLLGLLLLPLWICTAATEARAAVAGAMMAVTGTTCATGMGASDPGSVDPLDVPEDGMSEVEEDDDESAAIEIAAARVLVRVRDDGRGEAKFARRAGASPPTVHIEAETPPPRP